MKQSLDALVLSVLGHHSPSLTNQQHINSTHPHTQQQGAREGRENRGGESRSKGRAEESRRTRSREEGERTRALGSSREPEQQGEEKEEGAGSKGGRLGSSRVVGLGQGRCVLCVVHASSAVTLWDSHPTAV